MEINKMKKLLGLFCAIIALSGCSSIGESSLFGGSECESIEARDISGKMLKTEYSSHLIALLFPRIQPKSWILRLNG